MTLIEDAIQMFQDWAVAYGQAPEGSNSEHEAQKEMHKAAEGLLSLYRVKTSLPPLDEGEIAEVIQSSWRDVAESDRIENELETLWANDKCLEVSVAALHAARAVLAHIEAKGGKG